MLRLTKFILVLVVLFLASAQAKDNDTRATQLGAKGLEGGNGERGYGGTGGLQGQPGQDFFFNGGTGCAGGTGGTGGQGGRGQDVYLDISGALSINETAVLYLGGHPGQSGTSGSTGLSGAEGGNGGFANWPGWAPGMDGEALDGGIGGQGSNVTGVDGQDGVEAGDGGGGGSSGPSGFTQIMSNGGNGAIGEGGMGNPGHDASPRPDEYLSLSDLIVSDETSIGGDGGDGGNGGPGGNGGGGGGGAGGGGTYPAGVGGQGGPGGSGGAPGEPGQPGDGWISLLPGALLDLMGSMHIQSGSGITLEDGSEWTIRPTGSLLNEGAVLNGGLMTNEGTITNQGLFQGLATFINSGDFSNNNSVTCPALNLGSWRGFGLCHSLENQGTLLLDDPVGVLQMDEYHEEGQLDVLMAPLGCAHLRVSGPFSIGEDATLVLHYEDGFSNPQYGASFIIAVYYSQEVTGTYEIIDTLADQHDGIWELNFGVNVEPGYQGAQLVYTDPASAVGDGDLPAAFTLHPAHPNPFNPMTRFRYDLPQECAVEFRIFDVSGRQVWKGDSGVVMPAGQHEFIWQGRDDAGRALPSGTYLLRVQAGSFQETRRMALVR